MKKKLLFSAVILAIIFILAYRFTRVAPVSQEAPAKAPQNVTVQTAADSTAIQENLSYPALVVGDQEISVTAGATGTAVSVPFNLGDHVAIGSLLARIDNIGNTVNTDYKDFQSSQIQSTQISKEQAEENLSAAKQYYKDLKKAYDSGSTSVTKAQVNAADKQIDIAELQLDSAKVSLQGLLDNHLITSPISGYVTEKDLSTGDAISAGQKIATISATKKIKFQFFVDAANLTRFKAGTQIDIIGSDNQKSSAIVKNVSPVADPDTKRFMIEAYPAPESQAVFASGTLATVSLSTSQNAAAGDLLLPLSTITVGQNESHIFIFDNGKAKSVNVSIVSIVGENAEIKTDLAPDAQIIISGAKLIQDGSAVNVQK